MKIAIIFNYGKGEPSVYDGSMIELHSGSTAPRPTACSDKEEQERSCSSPALGSSLPSMIGARIVPPGLTASR